MSHFLEESEASTIQPFDGLVTTVVMCGPKDKALSMLMPKNLLKIVVDGAA